MFNSLNVLELKSLEEPRYLLGEFAKQPLACLTLAPFLITNTGGGRCAPATGLARANMRSQTGDWSHISCCSPIS